MPDGLLGLARDCLSGSPANRPTPEAVAARAEDIAPAQDGVTALDAATGGERWATRDVGAARALAVDDTTAYLLDRERRVRAVALADRSLRWTSARAVTGSGTARAAVTDGRLMVTADDGTAVLDTADGSPSRRSTWARRSCSAEAGRARSPPP
ncbi:PQQ-like beta-propeller repeat protein [Streptomyces cavernae]|uniref:PQQ-like beta-propeller repeat protein n=1 Tax=Streptomyces cavernae TaxID=2259034 RepID=UPI001EE43B6C|nr:PQQ-like beta-propeller repeat protein [Streptomyces cavernae]